MKNIGLMIKRERKSRGYTSAALAEAVGLSRRAICNVESGDGGRKAIEKVLDFLGFELTIKIKDECI